LVVFVVPFFVFFFFFVLFVVPLPLTGRLSALQVDNVCAWLDRLGLAEHAPRFRENDVDGSLLMTLTRDELTDDLGIKSLGVKKRILAARDALAK
jgi:hypothetical protein